MIKIKKSDLNKWLTLKYLQTTYNLSSRKLRDLALKGEVVRNKLSGTSEYKFPDTTQVFEQTALTEGLTKEDLPNNEVEDLTQEIEEVGSISVFLDLLEKQEHKPKILPYSSSGVATKILSLSDIHCPFHELDLIYKIIEEHKDADMCVLNGDIIDAYAVSSFSKDKHISLHTEYTQALELIKYVASIFDRVLLVRGNHDERVQRYYAKTFDTENMMLARKDILLDLAKGTVFKSDGSVVGTLNFKNVIYAPQGIEWIARVGKTVFMHPHSYSSGHLATVSKCLEHLSNFMHPDDFDCVVIGHTHKLGMVIEKNKLLIEQGCLTRVMDYQKVGALVNKPSTLGYAIISQDKNGNTIFNESYPVFLGTLNYI
jgi:predicted phosphodiesterase